VLSAGSHSAMANAGGLSPDPEWGTDIPLSVPEPSVRDLHRNIALSINPTNSNNVVAAYDRSQSFAGFTGYSWSSDAGRTWGQGIFRDPWYSTEPMSPSGDAHVAFDARGTAYFTGIAFGANTTGYFVLTSTNGMSWSTPVPVVISDNTEGRNKSAFTVDSRSGGAYAGSLYLFYIFTSLNGDRPNGEYWRGIWMRYSRDGGLTWSNDVPVSKADHTYSFTPSVAVASDGTIYAAFEFQDHYAITNTPKLLITKSTDGGATWGPDLPLGDTISQIGRSDWEGHELALQGVVSETGCSLLAIQHFPSIAVAPSNPDIVYAAWNDARWETSGDMCGIEAKHSDIAFSRSTDGGQTWSDPQRLNDDPVGNGADQFQPTIATSPDGTIGAIWYDRRLDPRGFDFDTMYSQSTDGGLTWSPNQRVSDSSSNPDLLLSPKSIDDLGFRRALVFGPNFLLPTWPDAHQQTGYGGMYTDRGLFPGSLTDTTTPTATGSPTPTRTSTVPATATATPGSCGISFSDVGPSDYFYEAVRYLYCRGAISGYADGTFRPYSNTTRGQLTKIVTLAEGWPIDTTGGPHFSDVGVSNPFYGYIETAYHRGIISGYGDGTFRWGNNVTRAQLCKIIVGAQAWPIDTHGGPHFGDVPADDPFYGFIETAFNHGVISGYSCGDNCLEFRPGNNATRGQICKIVYNALMVP